MVNHKINPHIFTRLHEKAKFVCTVLFRKLKTRMKNLQLKFLIFIIFETAPQNVTLIILSKIILTEMVATRLYQQPRHTTVGR